MNSTANYHPPPPPLPSSQPPFSDSDTDSDSENFQVGADLSNSIFKAYLDFSSSSSSSSSITSVDLSKIQSFLNSSSSGALSCLICLERIRPSDPTWSCSSLCFALFHLLCIQSWARQASDLSAARAAARLPITAETAAKQATWNCPKCRSSYSKSEIPKSYFCFCGKLRDPPSDNPWILPHSCGEICNRPLPNNCGHFCLLLCHPGPCPSCPKSIKTRCFCGSVEDFRRCGFKNFSCNRHCNKRLDCNKHNCYEICHPGTCPPCRARETYRCRCGKKEEKKDCCDRDFRCENECKKLLTCGKHVCERGCHRGACGECPLQGRRTCPCGERVYEGMPCDGVTPVCGATCNKLLNCGYHRCPERCHKGPCVETCRTMVKKSCRCGGLKKEVPCYQDLSCEKKCLRMRDCGRHACRRRCCDGDCPPCSEVCDKRLRCKNHKCPAPCHRGACAPCPLMVTISCACGETFFEVPCGTEMDQKPPKCRKLCKITPLCRHASNSKPHRCHYGPCPQCRALCEVEYPCGHKCNLRCHGPKPPPNPEFTLKPKKKKSYLQPGCTPGTPCPPCPELVWRPCVGEHMGAERMMVCSNTTRFSCDNLCGNLLPCGNHYCTKTCHPLETQPSSSGHHKRSETCEECRLPCEKERMPKCSHPCPLQCHPGECPPCKVLVKRSCHCGAMVHAFECIYYNNLSEKDQVAARSCGGPCHRKLPNCTHLCPEICHVDKCPAPDKCSKKVTVRCKCQTLKKEWICQDVQAAYHDTGHDPKDIPKNQFGLGLLACNSDCKSKVQEVESALQLRKPKVLEKKEPDGKQGPKRRKRRDRIREGEQVSRLQKFVATIKRVLLIIIIIAAVIAVTYYGYKGLLRLSDWMNEAELQRAKRRRPRI
ncbi:NF-X1-type zinc finger protein NFXL2 [Hibiscus syriacus]|uniref:NF-X1-type zinc finger protein NFXL2 n=1 Tax=Hibiscus syriacus TaxID=106335 RepID=A0A6A3BFG6_HIBSY|nr:NF-X1-type zinc finger protein NFXL2-like [Hibiscus syriacus]KAE8714837.1 NF-X1-type zinc finger protein NFXL2 [Hibiscus syriacus]